MPKIDFADALKQAEKEGLVGGGYLKLKDGANRMRLMSECLPHPSEYQGRKRFQWFCYVIDREDAKIKPFFMPHTIYKQIVALQMSEDYAFEEVPMPYDITINAKNAGTRDVEYSVVPARKNVNLTDDELVSYAATRPLKELQDAIRGKKGEHTEADGKPFDPDEVPY